MFKHSQLPVTATSPAMQGIRGSLDNSHELLDEPDCSVQGLRLEPELIQRVYRRVQLAVRIGAESSPEVITQDIPAECFVVHG